MTHLVTLAEIQTAHDHLPNIIRRTPIVPLARTAAEVGHEALFLKLENLQVTGV
jgi:threonine dehydratase